MIDTEPPARPGEVTVAGAILLGFGSLIAAVGTVLLVLFAILSGDAPLPDWLFVDRSGASAGAALLGAVLLTGGLAQVVAGGAAMGPGRSWARPAGIGLASLGAVGAAWGLVLARGSVLPAFLPVIAAYLFVILALALAPGWFRRRG